MCISGMQSVAKDHAPTSGEFFRLLARSAVAVGRNSGGLFLFLSLSLVWWGRLLNHAHQASIQIAGLDKLMEEELKWLLKVRVSIALCSIG